MPTSALIGALRVTLGLDSAAFEQGMSKSARSAKKGANDIERAFEGLRRGAGQLKTALLGAVTVTGALAAGRAYIDLADKAKQMRAQLSLATQDFGLLGQAQRDAERIAATTRVGLQATTSLYTTMLRASQPLGKSQDDAARATETFGKALKLGGAGAAEASSATLQFSQALASGVLRGDEFNSIAEASPRIMQLLADSLGVTRGKLRGMAEDGKLSADVLFRALTDRKFTEQIDREFTQLPQTFAESMTLLDDAATRTIGAFDRGGRFSDIIIGFVGTGEDGFTTLADSAEDLGISVRATFDSLRDVFEPMRAAGADAFDFLGRKILDLRNDIAQVLGLYDQINNLFIGADRFATRVDNALKRGGVLMGQERPLQGWSDTAAGYLRRYDAGVAEGKAKAQERRIGDALLPSQKFRGVDDIRAYLSGTGRFSRKPRAREADEPVEKEKKKAAAAAKRAAAEAKREAAKAEREAKERERDARRYADDLSQLEDRQLGLEGQLTTSAEDRAAIERRRIDLALEGERTDLDRRVKDGDLSAVQAKKLALGAVYNAGLERELVDRRLREEQRRQEFAQAEASLVRNADVVRGELQGARTQAERRRLQLQLLDIEYDRQRLALDEVLAKEDLSKTDRAIAEARKAQLATLQSMDRAEVERQTQGPLGQYLERLPRDAEELNEAYEQVATDGLQSLNDGLVDAIMNSKSLADVFKNVANQIIADLIRIAIQKTIVGALGKALDAALGGGGIGSLGSVTADANNALDAVMRSSSPAPMSLLPGMARGGQMTILGNRGIDRNVLSINGSPVARVNRGERLSVSPVGRGANDGAAVVQIAVQEGALFRPTVTGISGNVSAETVGRSNRMRDRLAARTLRGR